MAESENAQPESEALPDYEVAIREANKAAGNSHTNAPLSSVEAWIERIRAEGPVAAGKDGYTELAILLINDPTRGEMIRDRLAEALSSRGIRRPHDLIKRELRNAPGRGATWRSGPNGQPLSTDSGRTAFFVGRVEGVLRYLSDLKQWLVWREFRWVPVDHATVLYMAAEALQVAAENVEPSEREDLLSRRAAEDVLALACGDPRIATRLEVFDSDPYLLNTPSGVVDLRTGQLRPSTPGMMFLMSTRARYRPEILPGDLCPRFQKFLAEAHPSPEMQQFVLLALGMGLIGELREHLILFHVGPHGRNGKSTLLRLVLHCLGDYGRSTRPELFLRRGRGEHPVGLADLHRRRIVVCSEFDHSAVIDESRLKLLTGGDVISARGMHENFWEYTPSATFHIHTNSMPRLRGASDALRTRLRLLPWNVTFAGRENLELMDILRSEADEVLTLLIRMAVEYLRLGKLPYPAEMKAAAALYLEDQDEVGRFLSEECDFEPEARVGASTLHAAYIDWTRRHGERDVLSMTAFGTIMTLKGWAAGAPASGGRRKIKSSGWNYYVGIRLRNGAGGGSPPVAACSSGSSGEER